VNIMPFLIFFDEPGYKKLKIKQMIIEVHSGDSGSRDRILKWFKNIEDHGFFMYQMEHNYMSPDCMEFGFAHESLLI